MAQESAVGNRVCDAMVRHPRTHGSDTGLDQIRALFEDDHVHMALIVGPNELLITTIERCDLAAIASSFARIGELGTLVGRTVGPSDALEAATSALVRKRGRRLAVVDDSGRLLGLLCLKQDGTGFCSDEGIGRRAAGRQRCQPASDGGSEPAGMDLSTSMLGRPSGLG